MTLKQLYYFVKIAETKNLTKAAEQLNISQPPLSYQIKMLEEEFGIPLFIRDSRNLKITPAGKLLRDRAIQIISLVDKTSEELLQFQNESIVHIRIGTVSSINHNLLPSIIKDYNADYPNVCFDIFDGSSMQIQELVDSGVVDFGIIREPFNKALYSHRNIKLPGLIPPDGDYFVCVGLTNLFSNKYKNSISIPEIGSMPLILHRRFESLIMAGFEKNNLHPNIISRIDNIVTSIELLKSGIGISIMPYSSATLLKDTDDILIKKITDPVIYSNLYLISLKNQESNTYINAFLERI